MSPCRYDPSNRENGCKIEKSELNQLILNLQSKGYVVVGPRLQDEVIVYGEISGLADLPRGFRDIQEPGKYRVAPTEHDDDFELNNYFEYNLGPHSWKQFLFPPKLTVAVSHRDSDGWRFETPQANVPSYAFLGARACELAAIAVQDRVFLQGPYVDPDYKSRRESTVIIAVNCTTAAATCFCTSTDTGPKCQAGFDLALTELADHFYVEIGSIRGAELMEELRYVEATDVDARMAVELQLQAEKQISRFLQTEGLRSVLLDNPEHPRWDEIASRCLSCTNCTMVCPTCFCSSVSDVVDLTAESVQRVREWDSCFNIDFSYMADGVVRNSRRSRFRQWLTHKLASWHDQFETSGCVGCGRCITWCPVGIDLTEEVEVIRATPSSNRTLPIVKTSSNVCVLTQEPTE